MLHVKQIKKIVADGQTGKAHEALEQLLALGPHNTEALKLRAKLFEYEGRFTDEAEIWDKVAAIDRQDVDAISYLLRQQIEDREHFYFTDEIPEGGRRFLAYPRSLIYQSGIGLIGCLLFLLTTRLSVDYPFLNDPGVILTAFAVLVLAPWVGIIYTWIATIRSVTVTHDYFSVSTRMKTWKLAWDDIEKFCLAHGGTPDAGTLSLVMIPKNRNQTPLEIDVAQGSTAIRARSYLIREIARTFHEPEYLRRETLGLTARAIHSF